jgi:DNA-binding transcriptional MerR regulator
MTERFYIGGLAKLTGRSVHTIRWYEAQGLIPEVGRDAGGRRVYVQGHVTHLMFLERMRRTGMSVAELRAFTALSLKGWRALPECQKLLAAHRAHVEQEIEEWRAALDLIDDKMAYYAEWDRKKKRPPPLPHVPAKPKARKGAKRR